MIFYGARSYSIKSKVMLYKDNDLPLYGVWSYSIVFLCVVKTN